MTIDSYLKKAITFLFGLLLFATPLIFTPNTSELFEFNKILLVYGLTALIGSLWLARLIVTKKPIFNRTPLDIPLALFLISQIISLMTSIDRHTSFWGYYSRFNGGVLSLLSYALLYWAFCSNVTRPAAKKLLLTSLVCGVLVSIYGIFEHFGHSFSCLMFTNKFDVSCWIQDVQTRVFATLGQPNWLGAYLAILIFFSIGFFIHEWLNQKRLRLLITYYLLFTTFFSCLLFTFSRSAFLGLATGLIVFWVLVLLSLRQSFRRILPSFFLLTSGFLLLGFIFGTPLAHISPYLSLSSLQSRLSPPQPQPIATQSAASTYVAPQLEGGGTESGKIRQIVWQGALAIWRTYPLFGSGVETFAYAYYNFRPLAHNLVSEWDFIYNKAHNEYLNYLATTGAFGLGSYLLYQIFFIFTCLKKDREIMPLAFLAAFVATSVAHFFGFSVVTTNLYLFLLPGFAFVYQAPDKTGKADFIPQLNSHQKALLVFPVFLIVYSLFFVRRLWLADYYYAIGEKLNKAGQYSPAYQNLNQALTLSPNEPLFLAETSNALASLAALTAQDNTASTTASLTTQALAYSNASVAIGPKNITLRKTRVKTLYLLSLLDPKYLDSTISELQQAIKLAPTDPKLVYNLGLLYRRQEKISLALATINKSIEMKPNYADALSYLATFYTDLGQKTEAKATWQKILVFDPTNQTVQAKIDLLTN